MKPIVTTPNDVLTTPAKPVTFFDKRLSILLSQMEKTLLSTKSPRGVGLAAPQIGEPYRIFITRPKENSRIRVFINPVIKEYSQDTTEGVPDRDNRLEGCLSIPNVWGKVKRSTSVTIQYQDPKGDTHEETCSGFLAIIIQHETDHINGILFTQRVLEQQGKFYQNATDEDGKEILEEVKLT